MLVLTVKQGEPIWVGDNVVVFLCDVIAKDKVRIGIEAPKDMVVLRDKVMERMRKDGSDRDAE